MENQQQKRMIVQDMNFVKELFGNFDENIKLIKKHLQIDVISREGEIILLGSEKNLKLGEKLVDELENMIKKGESLTSQNVRYIIDMLLEGNQDRIKDLIGDALIMTAKGKPIKPKTLGQKSYLEEIGSKDLTFGIGPAGTGKTYLAVAMAVKAFRNEEVSRIILTRPAVEAGESLGFLPGDLKDKVDPYLRPLYDALFDIIGADKFEKYMERGLIEVAPLAYMRGRTLDNSFIILDEAQNTTREQMKMFLTRLGFGSKAVVTGDITQIDLPGGKSSGLKNAAAVLKDIKEIGFCYLTEKDVVRHHLVQKIIKAYDIAEHKKEKR
ncbi:phosphate starvation-inducible protein PhoH [Anaerovirgula multivorans]|uniref:PhoH-like protein n=2 Tax=Anaerovirgula multivorans TaxID=312168 RepID=A0A239IEI1_9FIRM|nr:PhoH family protein [Anaerovirgula multivorans]SNS92166.1 phosphate starvation-inducible protein PhoH [Anaerovirgula multivorans]